MNRRQFLQISAAALVAASGVRFLDAQQSATSRPSTRPVDRAARLTQLGNRGVGVHDPSTIVKCKDEYWVFYTGRGIPSWRSKDLIHWTAGPRSINASPAWVATAVPANRGGLDFWAPEVARIGDKYHLYFAVSTFGQRVSAIGLATNPTLDPADKDYRWTDQGIVVQTSAADNFNAIDPAIISGPNGSLWMSFGSFWNGIMLIELDPATGKRIKPDSPMRTLAYNRQIEASYVYHHDDYYYLIVNWGQCCRGLTSTYNMRIGRSKQITGPYLDKTGMDLARGGGSLLLETDGDFIGPGQAGIFEENGKTWISMHFYNGTTPRGTSMLALRPLSWGNDGWPVVGRVD